MYVEKIKFARGFFLVYVKENIKKKKSECAIDGDRKLCRCLLYLSNFISRLQAQLLWTTSHAMGGRYGSIYTYDTSPLTLSTNAMKIEIEQAKLIHVCVSPPFHPLSFSFFFLFLNRSLYSYTYVYSFTSSLLLLQIVINRDRVCRFFFLQ